MTSYISILFYVFIVGFILLSTKDDKKNKLVLIVFYSILFTVYNFYCTYNFDISQIGESDRYNYYIEFMGKRETSWGLTQVFNFVKRFTDNFNVVLYLTTFLCCFIAFLSYGIDKNNTIYSMAFLLLTDYVFTTFSHLKQCYSVVFAFLFFAIFVRLRESLVKNILCIVLIILSCVFHPAGCIMLAVFFLFKIYNPKRQHFLLIMLLILVVFLNAEYLIIRFSEIIQPYFPNMSSKLYDYFGNNIDVGTNSTIAFIKGFPFYYVLMLGVLNRNKLKADISNYDCYLMMALIGSILYVASVYSYWLYRSVAYFYLPIGTFFGLIINKTKDTGKTIIHLSLVFGSQVVILLRWVLLMYSNYGRVW